MRNKSKIKTSQNYVPVETDFGTRQVSHQNFSRIVALPKVALRSIGCNLDDRDIKVNITLVQTDDEKCIKITPVSKVQTEEEEDEDG